MSSSAFLNFLFLPLQASIPSDALKSIWSDECRISWGRKLHTASTADELLQCLTLLEDGIKREFLSVNYETSSEILSSSKVVKCDVDTSSPPWIPRTAPAVALKLMDLDSSICYAIEQTETRRDEEGCFNNFSSLYSALGGSTENASLAGTRLDNSWGDLRNGRASFKRGRGRPKGPTRTRGGKAQADSRKDNSTLLPGWKGRTRARGGRTKKGRRSIQSRQKPKRGGKGVIVDDETAQPMQEEEWNMGAIPVETEGAENVSSSERSEFDNDNEVDNVGYDDFSRNVEFRKSVERAEDADDADYVNFDDEYNDEDDEDEEEEDDDGVDEREEYFVEKYMNSDFREEDNGPDGGERVENDDDGDSASSSSSEYSY